MAMPLALRTSTAIMFTSPPSALSASSCASPNTTCASCTFAKCVSNWSDPPPNAQSLIRASPMEMSSKVLPVPRNQQFVMATGDAWNDTSPERGWSYA